MSNQEEDTSTAGKELVRRNHVPLWDAVVTKVIDDMVRTIKDEDMTDDVKGGVLRSKARKLTRLVDELDSGTSKYGVLSPVVRDDDAPEETSGTVIEADTPTSIMQLTDDEVWKRLQTMSAAEKQEFINEVTTIKGNR